MWDRGAWVPLEDPHRGADEGKLLFDLKGYKLHGKWTLVKLKKGDKEWLLIKERDGYVATGATFPEESVLSGLTVEALRDGQTLRSEDQAGADPAQSAGRALPVRKPS